MRQIVLDTETTGLEVSQGHRVIEIGCVEIINRKITRRHYHQYINPLREIDKGAMEVHGITNDFLIDKPIFESIYQPFIEFLGGSELIIHNASFDLGFLDAEISKIDPDVGPLGQRCSVVDSLELARAKHPGQKNSLDALCKRYDVDDSQREFHGALLDAEILADVYLLLTGGQANLGFSVGDETSRADIKEARKSKNERGPLTVLKASPDELSYHESKLDSIEKISGKSSVWRGSDSQ